MARLVCALIASLLAAPMALAESRVYLCEDIVEMQGDGEKQAVSLMLDRVSKLFMTPEPVGAVQVLPLTGATHWVTLRAGRFANVNCSEKRYEDQEMYPLGVVVQPLGILDLPVWTRAERGTPVLVLTEYGHRKIISLDDIRPIGPGDAYVFADSPAEAMYCRDAADCPGAGATGPDGACDNVVHRCGFTVGPVQGYAKAVAADDTLRETATAFRTIRRDAIVAAATPSASPDRLNSYLDRACRPFAVQAHPPLRYGTVAPEPHQPGPLALSLCSKAVGARAVMPLRVIDQAEAQKMFSRTFTGSFHRSLELERGFIDEKVAELFLAQVLELKDCGVALEQETTFTLGGGLGAEISALGFKADLGMDRQRTTTQTQSFGADQMLRSATYFIEPRAPAGGVAPARGQVFDILFRADCESGTATKPASITLYHEDFGDGYLPIRVHEDVFKAYDQANGLASYTPNSGAQRIQLGHFWTVKDHLSFYSWREALRIHLYQETPVISELVDTYPPLERPYVRDFFVYLLLAAAFHHQPPIQY